MKVTICGAGRTGHLNAVLFKQRDGVEVSVLTSSAQLAGKWSNGEQSWRATLSDGSVLAGQIDHVGIDASTALAGTDLVVVTQPAHARPALLRQVAPHLPDDKRVFVGAIPGFCGFDWLAEAAFGGRENVMIWGMKDVPHTAYNLIAGSQVRMGGAKAQLYAALHRREARAAKEELSDLLGRLYEAPISILEDYLEITLTPGNALMHPAVLYGLVGPGAPWEERPFDEPICWWSDCPRTGAEMLEACDAENQALKHAAERRLKVNLASVKPLKQELIEAYGDQIGDDSTMYSLLRTNSAYAGIRAPLVANPDGPGLVIDRESRAFHEDIAFGQALLLQMAKRLDVPVPTIETTYHWARAYHGNLPQPPLNFVPMKWAEAIG
ncbi:NAD/NADP octopine/nopaline dehydrogenase-like protein [Rhizobium azibense]|uniref:NAD/NADP octopine/nopaline dehydrogenase-like protein n=1 Tax=Rhizobium azibense TaxID=1136135 RepID=A0A4R3R9I3_9HYPH|nr:NAD/NADP octopine/nopaline dehydrogenase family protein [Rhizobium azibense]TCU30827.1 NAD/NADP octopine/nopaline dehydrogenase-like protein [Rhizobium azibense]